MTYVIIICYPSRSLSGYMSYLLSSMGLAYYTAMGGDYKSDYRILKMAMRLSYDRTSNLHLLIVLYSYVPGGAWPDGSA